MTLFAVSDFVVIKALSGSVVYCTSFLFFLNLFHSFFSTSNFLLNFSLQQPVHKNLATLLESRHCPDSEITDRLLPRILFVFYWCLKVNFTSIFKIFYSRCCPHLDHTWQKINRDFICSLLDLIKMYRKMESPVR